MRRGMLFAVAAIGAGAALASPGLAAAEVPTQDSVTAYVPTFNPGPFTTYLRIDARSGPSGENPTGSVSFDFPNPIRPNLPPITITGSVTCLAVRGRTATLVIATNVIPFIKWQVVDNHGTAAPDTFMAGPTGDVDPGCAPLPSGPVSTVLTGDIAVVDAQPKPRLFTHRECKLGGWATIGFKSRQQCDNFVRWQCNNGRHTYYGFPTRAVCRFVINRT